MILSIKFQFFCLLSLIGQKALTDGMILNLSKRVTSKSDLDGLVFFGLKMQKYITHTQLHDKPHGINEAALQVLNEWRKKNADPFQAYNALRHALEKAFMADLIYDVLVKGQ